jgi:hypothetical protein
MKTWSLVVAVKDEEVLHKTLLTSPDVNDSCNLILKRGYPSAATAYNEGLSESTGEVVVFAHTDVYLPRGWRAKLERILDKLEKADPNWGVLGVVGVAPNGCVEGHIYSTGLQSMLGQAFESLIETVSLDEVLLIVRRNSGLKFDSRMSGFHLYGTDLCLEAKRAGMKSYIVSAFCIHNSVGIRNFPRAFWRCYFYLRRKYWNQLPVRTCCTEITRMCLPMLSGLKLAIQTRLDPTRVGTRRADPERLYKELESSQYELKTEL